MDYVRRIDGFVHPAGTEYNNIAAAQYLDCDGPRDHDALVGYSAAHAVTIYCDHLHSAQAKKPGERDKQDQQRRNPKDYPPRIGPPAAAGLAFPDGRIQFD